MSIISKDNLSIVLQALKKLLSLKADKTEVVFRNEIEEYDAIAIALETGLLPGGVAVAEDGEIYTDENGVVYTL